MKQKAARYVFYRGPDAPQGYPLKVHAADRGRTDLEGHNWNCLVKHRCQHIVRERFSQWITPEFPEFVSRETGPARTRLPQTLHNLLPRRATKNSWYPIWAKPLLSRNAASCLLRTNIWVEDRRRDQYPDIYPVAHQIETPVSISSCRETYCPPYGFGLWQPSAARRMPYTETTTRACRGALTELGELRHTVPSPGYSAPLVRDQSSCVSRETETLIQHPMATRTFAFPV